MQTCPSGGLQPTWAEAGLEGLWSPVLVPAIGWCEFECHACGQVCPTEAIVPLPLPEKKKVKIGLAIFDTTRCLPFAYGRECIVCEEHCPVPDKAITFEMREVTDRDGNVRTIKLPRVDPERCTGCGICETKCVFKDLAAIRVVSANEDRHPGQPADPDRAATPTSDRRTRRSDDTPTATSERKIHDQARTAREDVPRPDPPRFPGRRRCRRPGPGGRGLAGVDVAESTAPRPPGRPRSRATAPWAAPVSRWRTSAWAAAASPSRNVVRYAYDHGINLFDTAESYGNGDSETKIGEAMKHMERDKIFIVTKLDIDEDPDEQNLIERFNKSLERLQTPYVDALYAHGIADLEAGRVRALPRRPAPAQGRGQAEAHRHQQPRSARRRTRRHGHGADQGRRDRATTT